MLPEEPHYRLLTREILYTGITRARRQVTIYGREKTLQAALQNRLRRHAGRMSGMFSSVNALHSVESQTGRKE